MAAWQGKLLEAALGLYLIGLGVLGGMLAERLRFDSTRDALLARAGEALQQDEPAEMPAGRGQ